MESGESKILIIDDEAPLRQLICAALRGKGFKMLEAEGGHTGVELAREQLPDLILCDVMMPKVDGFATLAALRQDATTAAIPCILMTGRPDSAGMRHGMSLGADDYLPKPFTIEELFVAVQARLKKQQAIKQLAEKQLADLRSSISLALPHELFTPLSGIIGFAEIISGDIAHLDPKDISEIGKAILASSKRLHRLVENFLIYAQIELLNADPAKVKTLRQSHRQVARDLLEATALAQSISFERKADLSLELVEGEVAILEEYLKKIVSELLENAFKFSDPGTRVTLKSEIHPRDYQFSVADMGRGMTPEQIAGIGAYMQFERKMYEQQGSGLGLAIAKRLTDLHGGTLTIQSTPGAGTTVTISLPR
jgi:two-component system, sensor histidine kinase and response regulator